MTDYFFENILAKLESVSERTNQLVSCIAYIAKQQGISLKLDKIKNINELNIESINLYEKLLGITFQRVSVDNNTDKNFHPILIQLDEPDEFRVILTNNKHKYNLYNPESDCIEKLDTSKKINKAWQCYPIDIPSPSSISELFALILRLFHKNFFIALSIGFLASATTLITSLFAGYIFSHIHELGNQNYLIIYISFFIIILCSNIFGYISNIFFKTLNHKIMILALPSVWHHVLSLPLETIKKFSSGDLVQRITDYESALTIVVTTIIAIFIGSFSLLFLLTYMAYCSLMLSLIYIVIYAILVCLKLKIISRNVMHTNSYLTCQGEITSTLTETLNQIDKIRSSNAENRAHGRWLYRLINAKIHTEQSAKLETLAWLIETIAPILLLVIFYIYLYANPEAIHPYYLLQFLICAGQLSINFEKLSTDILTFIHLLPGLKRLIPVISEDVEQFSVMPNNFDFVGEIKLLNVSLKNPQTGLSILENISINVAPGAFVALVGHSGAGKSSIFRLLLGFEPEYSGLISIDGEDIKTLDMNLVRKQFGVVLQTSSIFPGTIFSNIATNSTISLNDAWRLAELVGLDEEIRSMPMMMYTHISDNAGESISGGQKQKILIARALATQPKFLFMDEATSALDNNSQALIFHNLKSLKITRFVIAHRYSTIVNADLIYVVDKGRIVSSGSYDELVDAFRDAN